MSETDDLLPEFLAESQDILEKTHHALDGWAAAPNKTETLDAIFRNVHTIKGGSSMFGFGQTQATAHALESFLSQKKENPAAFTEQDLEHVRTELQKLEALLKNKDQMPAVAPSDVVALPTAAGSGDPNETFIRVPVQKVNDTMSAISEVFLIRNQMIYLMERFKSEELDRRDFMQSWDLLDGALRRSVGDLERSAMSMRMMNVQGLFSRMARVVQQYSSKVAKPIVFKTHGEDTELDKKILDALGEPLIHLVRNAMDHGIESSADRAAGGKSEQGTITLSARLSGNEAVIRISDDGKGMDPQKILASAKKKGIDVSHVTDDQSAIDLIFLPGFSTAEKVSDVSGRGVGMDAVRSSVTALGGRIGIETQIGKGSTFTIRLPVSMSLVPVILVDIKGLKYAVPTQDILETRQTSLDQIQRNSGEEYILFRDSYTECIDLRSKIGPSSAHHEEKIRECSVIFFEHEGQIRAARVSSFEGNTEIVAKPLAATAPRIPWINGASVLPTGEPIFVLSLQRIYEDKTHPESSHAAA